MSNGFGTIGLSLGNNANGGSSGQLAQIIKLPNALANNAKTLRLEGQITQINNQTNTARIQTAQGDIDVQTNDRNLQSGQRITVEIPAGRPPQQARIAPEAIVRPPEQTASTPRGPAVTSDIRTQNIPTNATQQNPSFTQKVIQKISQKITGSPPPQISNERTEGQQISQQNQTVARGSVETNVAKQLAAQAVKNFPNLPQPLAPNDVVRLLNTPPSQAQTIATQSAQTTQITQQLITAPTTALNTLQAVSSQQSSASLLSSTAQIASNNAPQILTTSLQITAPINTGVTSAANALLTPQTPTSLALTSAQSLNTTQINAALQSLQPSAAASLSNIGATTPPVATAPQNIAASLQPITFDPTNPNVVNIKNTPQIDVQILKILPPVPQITVPTAANIGSQASPVIPAATQFGVPILGNAPATALTAQVTGFTANGLPLITARLPGATLPQSFILQYKSNNLVVGSQLQISPKTAPTIIPLNSAPQPINPLLQGFQWPALDELYNGLLQISPQAAASLGRSLPSPSNPTQMGAAAMMFIAAVKSGDMADFIGDRKMELLQRIGKDSLLSNLRMGGDMSARAAPEAGASTEWRAVPLPMFWEGEIQRVTLYTRRENHGEQQNQGNNKNGSTRFVFDLSLTRMGDVQLDGFLKDQRLDLVIRTQNKFSQPMQQTMRQAYTGALDQTSLSGELNFQGSIDNWVHVLETEKQFGEDA